MRTAPTETEPTFGRGCTSFGDMMAGLTCRDMQDEVQPRPNKDEK